MTIGIDDDAVVWSDHQPFDGRMLVLLLHGYGQDEHALAIVTDALGPGVVTAALRGPRASRDPLPGGRGWYDVDARIQPEDDQENETAAAVLAWLDACAPPASAAPSPRGNPSAVAIVGFSQGGALALHLLRHAPERFAAVVMLAGIWLPGAVAGDSRLAELRPPLLWGRTEHDFAIAPDLVASTEAALASTVTLTHTVYPGDAHAILPEELTDLVAYLRDHTPDSP